MHSPYCLIAFNFSANTTRNCSRTRVPEYFGSASQILTDNGFTKVYNMQGGMTAWMQANYKIDTTYHYISVDANYGEVSIDIQPFLLYQATCTTCQEPCSDNHSQPDVPDVVITILEDTENHTAVLLTFDVNGSTIEINVEKTLLWSQSKTTSRGNKTVTLVSFEIYNENNTVGFYQLKDVVEHEDYILTVETVMAHNSAGDYSNALTNMSYTPTIDKGLASYEQVVFNSSVTLSQHYTILGDVASNLARIYQRSENHTVRQMSDSYHTMAREARYMSNLVQTQLYEYDEVIESSVALLSDDIWSCLLCAGTCVAGYTIACAACCGATIICCVCFDWYALFGLEIACSMICEILGSCP